MCLVVHYQTRLRLHGQQTHAPSRSHQQQWQSSQTGTSEKSGVSWAIDELLWWQISRSLLKANPYNHHYGVALFDIELFWLSNWWKWEKKCEKWNPSFFQCYFLFLSICHDAFTGRSGGRVTPQYVSFFSVTLVDALDVQSSKVGFCMLFFFIWNLFNAPGSTSLMSLFYIASWSLCFYCFNKECIMGLAGTFSLEWNPKWVFMSMNLLHD